MDLITSHCPYMASYAFFLTSREPSTCSGVDESHKLLVGHIQQLVQVHAAEGELPKSTLLLERGNCRCVLRRRGRRIRSMEVSQAGYPPSASRTEVGLDVIDRQLTAMLVRVCKRKVT